MGKLHCTASLLILNGRGKRHDKGVAEITHSDSLTRPNVVHCELIEIDRDEDSSRDDVPSGVVISGEKDSTGTKDKEIVGYGKNWLKPWEASLVPDTVGSDNMTGAENAPLNLLKVFGPESVDSSNPDSIHSDLVANNNDDLAANNDDIDEAYEDDENFDYDDNDDMDYDDYDDDIDYLDYETNLDAQFDAVDLPAGVEASVPWLTDPSQPSTSKAKDVREDDVEKKYKEFKHFDVVADYSDHYYADPKEKSRNSFSHVVSQAVSLTKKASKDWSKTIQQEWKILEKDLPETIFVRVYEERLDLLRAVIVGASGTPYHDGLFFFDVHFPPNYPNCPPLVRYHSGGLRLNPNLYTCGKVCLSLLNTWHGSQCEMWTPGKSTMLQVLVSIQALVLNEKPYFNEPGYAKSAGKPGGEMKSISYNEDVFVLSCKTMLYTLRRPPKHFEDFVAGHFRTRAHNILQACKAYMDGAQIASPMVEQKDKDEEEEEEKEENKNEEKNDKENMNIDAGAVQLQFLHPNTSANFKTNLGKLLPTLLVALADNGADCRQFVDKPPETNECMRMLRIHKFDD
ncbi:ubiquitin-conjugating enzyme [Asimina triloba]